MAQASGPSRASLTTSSTSLYPLCCCGVEADTMEDDGAAAVRMPKRGNPEEHKERKLHRFYYLGNF